MHTELIDSISHLKEINLKSIKIVSNLVSCFKLIYLDQKIEIFRIQKLGFALTDLVKDKSYIRTHFFIGYWVLGMI